ncbi:hypothetical protein PHSC3_000501 [Chlamydiales bacterium STE3]|nr:hypothetical protein PHSC3_000501 [Chlamydiales bacterium STE3]
MQILPFHPNPFSLEEEWGKEAPYLSVADQAKFFYSHCHAHTGCELSLVSNVKCINFLLNQLKEFNPKSVTAHALREILRKDYEELRKKNLLLNEEDIKVCQKLAKRCAKVFTEYYSLVIKNTLQEQKKPPSDSCMKIMPKARQEAPKKRLKTVLPGTSNNTITMNTLLAQRSRLPEVFNPHFLGGSPVVIEGNLICYHHIHGEFPNGIPYKDLNMLKNLKIRIEECIQKACKVISDCPEAEPALRKILSNDRAILKKIIVGIEICPE